MPTIFKVACSIALFLLGTGLLVGAGTLWVDAFRLTFIEHQTMEGGPFWAIAGIVSAMTTMAYAGMIFIIRLKKEC